MFTPRDIRDMEFEKVSRGYRVEDVDGFLSRLADQMEQLNAQKEEAEKKMMLLADKVEEYRKDEGAIRNALIGVERMKESILTEANQQKEILVRDAQQKADDILSSIEGKINREELTLKALKQKTAKFKNDMLGLYKGHLEMLSEIPDEPIDPEFDESIISDLFGKREDDEIKSEEKEEIHAEAAPEEAPAVEEAEKETVDKLFDAVAPVEQKSADDKFSKLDFGENFSFGR